MPKEKLKRNLSFISMLALASGAVIGGWLTEAPYWFEVTGAGSALIFPLLAVLLIPVGLAFAELTSMLPFASAVDVWTSSALGHKAGWAAQWMMFLVQVVEPPMMAFIFIAVLKIFINLTMIQTILVSIAIVVAWYIVSNYNIGITGTLANIFFFAMMVLSITVCAFFFLSGHWDASNLTGGGTVKFFTNGFKGVFMALAVFSLKFIGFELTPTLIEETNFPAKKMWKVILSALFIPALLYCVVVFGIAGLGTPGEISLMSIAELELVQKFSMPMIIAIMAIVAGLLHAITTIMAFWTSSARCLYGAAELKQLPPACMKLNKNGQPAISNLIVLAFSIFFCIFTGLNQDGWVNYIYSISCVAAGLVYFVCCLDALVLRKKHPEWKRPYKAPGKSWLFIVGMIVSIWIMVGSCIALGDSGIASFMSLIVYSAVGLIIYIGMEIYRKKDPANRALVDMTPDDIDSFE